MTHTALPAPNPQISGHLFQDDGAIPNNLTLPLLIYQGVLTLRAGDPAAACESLFASNQWGSSWRNGIYSFHHYHSTAHEVLAICRGEASVQFGGQQGSVVDARAGDVVAIPAGVGHKNLGSSPDLLVVGAYPPGQKWDLCYGEPHERPQVLENIRNVDLPSTDPVYGAQGPLMEHWR